MTFCIDTHTHLHFEDFREDLDEVIERARQAGVAQIITLGTDLASSIASLEIAHKHPNIFSCAGIHPSDAHLAGEGDAQAIEKLIRDNRQICAVGEIGLDFYWEKEHYEAQYRVFGEMLRMARRLEKPVVIHNRDAQREMIWFFQEEGFREVRGVMHCFAGDLDDARFYLDMGLHISFTANITFPNFREEALLKFIPADRLLLETDSPFIAPKNRPKRNEPGNVVQVGEKLAAVRGISYPEICRITNANAQRLFGLPAVSEERIARSE
ncbi:MAG TPA: TatD family hydrolase [Calditrichia bacterium]|nr:TatD family hydrolase [Calditrichota bacterium]HQU74151.1 TatD family hydrolase [Calditrichia bacterium]HQV33500.1 TatD family hydrolase [Calditrichia bacterium]